MPRLDAHIHFWNYHPQRDAWINDDMAILKQDFLPASLAPLLVENGIDGCIAVQADQSAMENEFLSALAKENPFIKGIVGWTDMRSPYIESTLENFQQQPIVKGFRHILQGESHRAMMLQPAFLNGVRAIGKKGYSYDILIHADQIGFAADFAALCPDQLLIIDHLAKPDIKTNSHAGWKKAMTAFKKMEHVSCKLSGLITEADWKSWSRQQIEPYIETIVELFGTKRLLFGSDWPVCLLAGTYQQVVELIKSFFSAAEQDDIFYNNAITCYKP